MKTGFSQEEQAQIMRAKSILKQLWKNSGLSQKDILSQLKAADLGVPQSTLSTWFSTKEGNYYRPKAQHLSALANMFCPPHQLEETLDELMILLGYIQGPNTPESLKNKIAEQLHANAQEVLEDHQRQQRLLLNDLEQVLEWIEPLVMDYNKGYPTLFIPAGERKLLWQVLGKDKALQQKYKIEGGYEIPFSQLRCVETLTDIVNRLNEGTRLLQAYIDRHITDGDNGILLMDFHRVEDFVMYSWEICDKLLNNNELCKAMPVLKRTLLRTMTVAWGIQYILENQNRHLSEIQFHNVLKLKGKKLEADIYCSTAVYTGALARQYLRSIPAKKALEGWTLYEKASQQLEAYYAKLNTEHDCLFYKKELANLYYDIANYTLNRPQDLPEQFQQVETLMKQAHKHYNELMDNPNVFIDGLSESRALHIQIFYMISACWALPLPKKAIRIINQLRDPQILDESFWKVQIAKAIAYCVLSLKAKQKDKRETFKAAAQEAIHRASLLDNYKSQTRLELETEYALRHVLGAPMS